MRRTFTTRSAGETMRLGALLARELSGSEVLALTGTLGAGKTTFIKGLAKGLGVRSTITSPTFVLMKVYPVKRGRIKQFVHVDCYRLPATRLNSSKSGRHGVPGVELAHIGLGDYMGAPDTVVAIEWAGRLKLKLKPTRSLSLHFSHSAKLTERSIVMKPPRLYSRGILHFFGGIRRSTLLRSSSYGGSALRIHPRAYARGLLRRRIKHAAQK